MVDNGSYHESLANEEWLLLLETMLAKEASREYACKGNLLDCLLLQSIAGIAVRTKWQSGLITGNSIIRDLNRNGCFGDITVFRREILPDLSRKVYLLYCHQIIICIDFERLEKYKMETDSKPKKQKANSLDRKKWILFIWIFTFVLSAVMTVVSSEVLRQVNILVAVIILLVIILVSIIFDMIGTAVTAATEIQFHSMAARKVRGAKSAIRLIRNADKVSNFCNDVVGDVCGIVSGAASTYVVIKVIERGLSLNSSIVELAFGGVIAALTVGGKAIGKSFAITNSNNIIYRVASIISFFKRSEHK